MSFELIADRLPQNDILLSFFQRMCLVESFSVRG